MEKSLKAYTEQYKMYYNAGGLWFGLYQQVHNSKPASIFYSDACAVPDTLTLRFPRIATRAYSTPGIPRRLR